MKRPFLYGLMASAAVLIALPWGISAFTAHDAGMALSVLLLLIVNPVWFVFAGIFSARDTKRLWALPIASAALFLLGAWITFEWLAMDFLWYAGAYAVVGYAVMLVTALICSRKARSSPADPIR